MGFVRSLGRSPLSRLEKAGHYVSTELWRERCPFCGQRESVVRKTNFDVDTKKRVGQGTMTPQCAWQMRSTFGADILMHETDFLKDGNMIQHTSEEDDERGSETSHGHANTVRLSYLENDDIRGKHIEVSTCNKAFGKKKIIRVWGLRILVFGWKVHDQSLRLHRMRETLNIYLEGHGTVWKEVIQTTVSEIRRSGV